MHPVAVFDLLRFERSGQSIRLTCNCAALPTDSRNLVFRAAKMFLEAAGIRDGVGLHLEKKLPLAAGLGGGSGNAATTLLGLNELFGEPLVPEQLRSIAATLGSDVPFFLQTKPALATGRGEIVEPIDSFSALRGAWFLLMHPGFGIATAWAYQQVARFPEALNGRAGRARELIACLQNNDLKTAGAALYNSLEAPALKKYPLLALVREFFRENGAPGALMSGSGSSIFAIVESEAAAETLSEKFRSKFGRNNWLAMSPA